jgi:hypothetical protein
MPTKIVLGLSANTRMVAFAVIQGSTLVRYGSSLHKSAWNQDKPDRILSRLTKLLTTYTITDVALALPYESHSTDQIIKLLESITTYFQAQKIPVCSYNQEAYYLFCEEGQPQSKKEMMENISRLYPELERLFRRELRNKNKYYIKLFEAVGLAHIHSQCRNQHK